MLASASGALVVATLAVAALWSSELGHSTSTGSVKR